MFALARVIPSLFFSLNSYHYPSSSTIQPLFYSPGLVAVAA